MVMIFTLVSAAQEWLNSRSDTRRQESELAEEKRIRDEEEAERVCTTYLSLKYLKLLQK